LAKVAEVNLTHSWAPFGKTPMPLSYSPDRLFVDHPPHTVLGPVHDGHLCKLNDPLLIMRHPLQLQSNCSRVLMLGIETQHIKVARRRSSLPYISHSQWLSTVRGARQFAR